MVCGFRSGFSKGANDREGSGRVYIERRASMSGGNQQCIRCTMDVEIPDLRGPHQGHLDMCSQGQIHLLRVAFYGADREGA